MYNKRVKKNAFFLKGDICWSSSPHSIETVKNGFLLCLDGKSGGVFKEVPGHYEHLPVKNHSGKLIIPGLTDLHVHAPQFSFRSLGMDLELLDWLNVITFPEETKYRDPEYAREAYGHFIDDIKRGPNTRLCVYATIHVPGTLLLMDMLEESGLVSFVGKVNMDRNCLKDLMEHDAAGATREWLETFNKRKKEGRYKNTAAILTPRFLPSCSDKLMKSLVQMQREYGLPLQSHLSENREEVRWVRELCPDSENYAGAYADSGLMEGPAIMAHCVWTDEREMDLLSEKGVYIAHCPQSNTNLSSGIAPAKRFMEKGIPMGLGSDVAGGVHTSIFRAMTDAIQVSKLRRTLGTQVFDMLNLPAKSDRTQAARHKVEKALTLEEAFYLGTAGGGSFFGKRHAKSPKGAGPRGVDFGPAGSFEKGWDFDALIIDDSALGGPVRRKLHDRLERVVYLSDDRHIIGKYVRGISVL